jgi:tetratricopeptide (TPR) repeat protein
MRCLWFALTLCCLPAIAMAQTPAQKHAEANKLLDALKTAPNAIVAARLEGRIQQLWATSGSPAVTLLMMRGMREMKAGADSDAIEDFGDAIVLDPALAAAYRARAMARYHAGDTTGAAMDLQAAVRHEPRDFAAYEDLARIAAARSDWKAAYEAWQKLMEIDPQTPGGAQRLKELQQKAQGQET